MKKLMFLLLLISTSTFILAQTTRDVVSLKNGSVIKGQIIEYTPGGDGMIKIETGDGSLLVYSSSEVLKVTKETLAKPSVRTIKKIQRGGEVNFKDYGTSQISFGAAIGGGGLIGVPVQYHLSPETALEAGLYFRPVAVTDYYDEVKIKSSIMLAGGVNHYFNQHYKRNKQKVKKNGISVKAGKSFGKFSQTFLAAGWVSEGFRKENTNRSFIFELGLGVMNSNFSREFQISEPGRKPLIYWKVAWNFYKD